MKRVIPFFVLIFIQLTTVFSDSSNVPNGTILENSIENGVSILIRKHDQVLVIDYSAEDFQLILYNSPFDKTIIKYLDRKSEIHIHKIYIINASEMWLEISINSDNGFILFNKSNNRPIFDYYKDNLWQPLNIIQSANKVWHTIKCDDSYIVYTNLNIRENPGISNAKIGMITANQSNPAIVKVTEITKEKELIDGMTERWAKIIYGDVTGWVFAGYLQYERGGPRFNTPESLFEMSLGAGP